MHMKHLRNAAWPEPLHANQGLKSRRSRPLEINSSRMLRSTSSNSICFKINIILINQRLHLLRSVLRCGAEAIASETTLACSISPH